MLNSQLFFWPQSWPYQLLTPLLKATSPYYLTVPYLTISCIPVCYHSMHSLGMCLPRLRIVIVDHITFTLQCNLSSIYGTLHYITSPPHTRHYLTFPLQTMQDRTIFVVSPVIWNGLHLDLHFPSPWDSIWNLLKLFIFTCVWFSCAFEGFLYKFPN